MSVGFPRAVLAARGKDHGVVPLSQLIEKQTGIHGDSMVLGGDGHDHVLMQAQSLCRCTNLRVGGEGIAQVTQLLQELVVDH